MKPMLHDFKLFNTLKMKTRDHLKHIEIQYFASLFMIFIQLNLLVVLLSMFCWSEWGISQTELGFIIRLTLNSKTPQA